jgi:organic hydroperoxide reductase OsmC/OhrA
MPFGVSLHTNRVLQLLEDDVDGKRTFKSFRYNNRLVWNGARRGKASADDRHEIDVGSPPEFKGSPDVWSPEELLVASLNGCLMLTFMSLAQNQGVQFAAYESSAEGLLENVDGTYRITEVSVQPNVALKSQADLDSARKIMDEVEKHCFISNSITAQVKLTPQFRVGAEPAS